MDAGKSTFLGVLTQGLLDNGRGSARLNLFRHLHEVHSGRTSSISYDILGFDTNGQVIVANELALTACCITVHDITCFHGLHLPFFLNIIYYEHCTYIGLKHFLSECTWWHFLLCSFLAVIELGWQLIIWIV